MNDIQELIQQVEKEVQIRVQSTGIEIGKSLKCLHQRLNKVKIKDGK